MKFKEESINFKDSVLERILEGRVNIMKLSSYDTKLNQMQILKISDFQKCELNYIMDMKKNLFNIEYFECKIIFCELNIILDEYADEVNSFAKDFPI